MKTYIPTIGLEVHAELKTETKMFCDSKNEPHHGEPNSHICPVCMAHPGTLPVINKKAVEHVVKVGLALQGSIADYTEFDRKNYFYPDIPKGYQISQYAYPIVSGGSLCGISITRVHLEEDTARSLHDQGEGSIVDYNRAGVPLMELVTEPVIHDAKTAGNFARELQLLLRTLGVSDANMEKGEMRVEANISISDTEKFGTKVEVKNLNSFKSVEGAIAFEIKRQSELLDSGGVVVQETRGWDETKGKTFSQRVKESANDYRYFPDPDLPKINLSIGDLSVSRIQAILPALPAEKREKYGNLGLTSEQVEIIIADIEVGKFFSSVILNDDEREFVRLAANYLTSDVISLRATNPSFCLGKSNPELFRRLILCVHSGKINSRVAKDLLPQVIIDSADPEELILKGGLAQDSSLDSIQKMVDAVISENAEVALEVKHGKEAALQFLVGMCMKASKGSANPKIVLQVLKATLSREL
jgi:aspartyl-tRNA(Asn)/glutamyl-tRNA(Gln) amidotransferase subunit B